MELDYYHQKMNIQVSWQVAKQPKVPFIWGELAHLAEMILIPRSYGIFCLTSIQKFVLSLEKDCFDHVIFKWFYVFKHFLQ